MKKIFIIIISFGFVLIVLSGCKKSMEEEFNAANGDIAEKYLTRVEITSNDVTENVTYLVNYDRENRISSVTDGTSSHFFSYNSNNNLATVTDKGEPLDINNLYQSPYDAFETGNVLEYDSKGNPIKIECYEDGFKSDPLIGEIVYDPTPNPYFYTLKAARIIEVLDRVDLNFGTQSPSIIKARLLLPYNNISDMIFKDLSGNTKYEVHIDYTYAADKYPISAVANAISLNESHVYEVKYFYK